MENISIDLVLKLCTKVHFKDYSIEERFTDTLITLKLSDSKFLRIVASHEQPSVFAYYEGKNMIKNGAGKIEDVIDEAIIASTNLLTLYQKLNNGCNFET